MAFFNEFPHTRTYDSDLAWLIKNMKELLSEFETLTNEFEELKKYVNDTLATLPELVDQALQDAFDDGRLEAFVQQILQPTYARIDAIENHLSNLQDWADNLVIDNLDSTDAAKALSANMGRVLKGMINDLATDTQTALANLRTELTAEINTTNSNLSALQTNVTTEVARLDRSDAALGVRIDTLTANVNSEVARLDQSIANAITTLRSEIPPIIDNLGSSDAGATLSAKQGKVLKDLIDALTLRVTVNETDISNIKDDIVRLDAYDATLLNKIDAGDARLDAKIDALDDSVDTRIDALRADIPTVVDTLNSASLDDALSANMGRVLKEMIQQGGGGVTVVDNLNSTSATDALSANQGRVLNEKIDAIPVPIVETKNITWISSPTNIGTSNYYLFKVRTKLSDIFGFAPSTEEERVIMINKIKSISVQLTLLVDNAYDYQSEVRISNFSADRTVGTTATVSMSSGYLESQNKMVTPDTPACEDRTVTHADLDRLILAVGKNVCSTLPTNSTTNTLTRTYYHGIGLQTSVKATIERLSHSTL